jgi:ABC-type branched-subunit amino acid transport system substrate-binding protein
MTTTRRFIVLVAVAVLVAAACGRGDDGTSAGTSAPDDTSATTEPAADDGLDAGAFGDLGTVCSEGEGEPEPIDAVPGIDGTTINVATIADPGFQGRPGLNQEMFDSAEAVVAWCNEHGGVRGYDIELHLRDAALTNYQPKIIEACDEDFFMVGGGAVFDDTGQADRLECALPDIAGFLVTPTAIDSDLALASAPNPLDQLAIAELVYAGERWPDATDRVGIMTGAVPATQIVRDRTVEAMEGLGWEVVYNEEYNPLGESSWRPFAQAMSEAGVELFVYVGEPENFAALQQAARDIGFEPTAWLPGPNHYDANYITVAGDNAQGTFTRTITWPFERADENTATAQYLELMETYKPDGKYPALLGAQALSSWLLFLRAVGQCVDAGTLDRDCVFTTAAEQAPWTGGGLHAAIDPTGGDTVEPCALILEATPDGFVLVDDVELDDTGFSCDPAYVVDLTGDYGTGARCPSGVEDPLPSECAG